MILKKPAESDQFFWLRLKIQLNYYLFQILSIQIKFQLVKIWTDNLQADIDLGFGRHKNKTISALTLNKVFAINYEAHEGRGV